MSQTIFRISKDRDNPYVMLDKRLLSDNRLTWKAKGILSYLLSKPDGWIVQISDIVKQSEEGENAVRAGVNELIRTGYIKRKRIRGKDGQFFGYLYKVHEQPVATPPPEPEEPPYRGFPDMDNPDVGFPDVDNRDITNTDSIKVVVNSGNDVLKVFCEATGMVAFPPSGVQYIETIQLMLDSFGHDETLRRLVNAHDPWVERETKDGQKYNPMNLKWIEYAVADMSTAPSKKKTNDAPVEEQYHQVWGESDPNNYDRDRGRPY